MCWYRRGSIIPSPGGSTANSDQYHPIFESEVIMDMRHCWEPFQREPRWEVQAKLLEALKDKIDVAARGRWGDMYRQKMLMKAQNREVVMDEKLAYLMMHSMGGYDGGGRWRYMPASLDGQLTEEQEHPRLGPYRDERLRRWEAAERLAWEDPNCAFLPPLRRISTRRRLPERDAVFEQISDSEASYPNGRPPRRAPSTRSHPVGYGSQPRVSVLRNQFEPRGRTDRDSGFGERSEYHHFNNQVLDRSSDQSPPQAKKVKRQSAVRDSGVADQIEGVDSLGNAISPKQSSEGEKSKPNSLEDWRPAQSKVSLV